MPCLLPMDLRNPGIEPTSLASPALQANSLPLSYGGKPRGGIETKSTNINKMLYLNPKAPGITLCISRQNILDKKLTFKNHLLSLLSRFSRVRLCATP